MAVPVLTHGSQIWTMIQIEEAKIKTAETKFCRIVAGYTKTKQELRKLGKN
jgi:hypothetical protein